jgi:hypothetical protein
VTTIDIHRRRFMTVMGGAAAAALAGCRDRQPSAQELAAMLELSGDERGWVTDLSDEHLRDIVAGLEAPEGRERDRAAQLLARMLTPRHRVCSFSRYPAAGLKRGPCNGLFRE